MGDYIDVVQWKFRTISVKIPSVSLFVSDELIHLFARAGLNVKAVYSDYNNKPYDAAFREGRMIIMAEK